MGEDKQIDKFKDAAREAECDMDEKAFDEALKTVSKSKDAKTKKSEEHSKNKD